MVDHSEKRDFIRMPIDCMLSFKKQGSDETYTGNVINLSSKGVLFTSENEFREGDVLEIVLTPSNSLTPPMEATTTVSRITSNGEVFEIACEITEILE